MKDIAIYGAGGFGREVACLIKRINEKNPSWNFIGFFDDVKQIGSTNEYGTVLGNIDTLNAWQRELSIAISICSPKALSAIRGKITNEKIDFPNVL